MIGLIVGFSVVQLTTMTISIIIKYNTYNKVYTNIGDSGYKIDSSKIDDILKEQQELQRKNNIFDVLCFCIPGINIASSISVRKKEMKKLQDIIKKNDALVPMTEHELKRYQEFNNIYSKSTYIACVDVLTQEINKIMPFFESSITTLEKNIAQLYYDKLPVISYTLDEVKQLSESIDSSYKLGMLDEISTAIIGLPNKECKINEVLLKKKDDIVKLDFNAFDENEAENKRFVIYPYNTSFEENDKLKSCYQKIVKDRDNYRKNFGNRYNTIDKAFVRVKRK